MASSSSSVQQKDQVFLSFRGEDTRNNFISHLQVALERKGIGYFIDYQLIRGEKISQALLTTIEKSKISIIVLSKNYASSSWCLDELCKILECKKRNGQEVIPIFYHVDPSDVRNQNGSFEEALVKHQERFKDETDKMETWRNALKEVCGLSGYHIQPHLPESTLIMEIVKDISKKLTYKSLYDTKRLVGINSHVKRIESLLCIDSANVRNIGIVGMGGIGKTTIAEAIYNLYFAEFDGFCFVNVKEELNHGKFHLREKLFSEILEDKSINLGTSFLPASIIDRLHCKKILIVLDDVNDSTQLLDLLLEKHYFGPGSRIIVTSRDKQVLRQVVDEMYEVDVMVDDEALQLFSMYAFKQSHPKKDFIGLSQNVIHYAKGVPLALRVVGSALYGKNKCVWEGHLNKLKKYSDPEIDKVLRISYDGLDEEMKGIFLDIACFFRWEQRDYVENILDGCYISVTSGISILVDKSLITILHDMINMHDLLQLMAWNIIREKSKEPGRHSRLWTPKDIYHVLKNNTGTESVEGVFLNMSQIGKLCLSPTAFKKMWNLKLLKFYYTDFKRERNIYLSQQGLEYLPDSLSYLHWDDYPSKSLPSSFCPENLVKLSMPNSHIKRLWNGVQDLVKLKRLDLSDSQHLIKIPDLSQATNLDSMKLNGCRSLVELPSSIRYLNKLDLSYCKRLQSLPELPPNLQYLNAHSCSSLEAVSSLFTLGRGTPITYLFTSCLKLNQNAISHILAETRLWMQHRATEDLKHYFQVSLFFSSRSLSIPSSAINICLPGSEIPEWFSCQNNGFSVTTQLPHLDDFLCFALCAVVAVEGYHESISFNVDCIYNFKSNYGDHHDDFCRLGVCEISADSDYMLLGYAKTRFLHFKCFSEVSFEFYALNDCCKVKKCGVHLLGSDLIWAKNTEESNSIMLYQPSSSFDPTRLSLRCGVNNQDFGEPMVEDGTIIKGCHSDHCYDEAEPSGRFDAGGDTIMIQPSSPYDPTWLSLNCGVIDQGFGEPMQEGGTIIDRCHDDHHSNEAEPSRNFGSEQLEEEPHTKRLKCIKFF